MELVQGSVATDEGAISCVAPCAQHIAASTTSYDQSNTIHFNSGTWAHAPSHTDMRLEPYTHPHHAAHAPQECVHQRALVTPGGGGAASAGVIHADLRSPKWHDLTAARGQPWGRLRH